MKIAKWFVCSLISLTSLLLVAPLSGQTQNTKATVFADSAILFQDNNKELDQTSCPYRKPAVGMPKTNSDFLVNTIDGESGAKQEYPNIAVDGNGHYMVTWVDQRNGKSEVFAQFYDKNDQPVGTNVLVSDYPNNWNSRPAIATNLNGDYIITWAQESYQILAQRFTSNGAKAGVNFQLNSRNYWNTNDPSIAVSESGSFLAVWTQQISRYILFARLFDVNGVPLSDELIINVDSEQSISSLGWGNRVAVDSLGNYVITWSAHYEGSSKIFLQKVSHNGQKIGANVIVSDINDDTRFVFPSINATNDGHFLVTWEGDKILARIFHVDDHFITDQFIVFDSQSSWHPTTVSTDKKDTFLIHWFGGSPLMCQKISTGGQFLGGPTVLGSASADSLYGSRSTISTVSDGHFYAVFGQYHISDPDVVLQKYDLNYQPVNGLTKVHDDSGSSWQNDPLTYFNHHGNAIILWEDLRNGRYDLYAQTYDPQFNPLGDNLRINNFPPEHWFLESKAVKSLSDGTFIVAFTGSKDSYYTNIYLQRVSESGAKIGPAKLVKKTFQRYHIAININQEDQILVCWYDGGYSGSNAFSRMYDRELSPISPEEHFLESLQGLYRRPFVLSVNDSLAMMASWSIYDPQTYLYDGKIYSQFFDKAGHATSPVLIFDEYARQDRISSLDNSFVNQKNYLISWIDHQRIYIKRQYDINGPVSFVNSYNCYQRNSDPGLRIVNFQNQKAFISCTARNTVHGYFLNDNKHKNQVYLLHQFEPYDEVNNSYKNANAADVYDGKLLLAYESNKRAESGYDIWANVQNYDEINFNQELFLNPSNNDVLYQNYPNPFNNSTSIAYQLLAYHKVRIAIYDVLGREVKVLINEGQEAGGYEIEFDASDLPSGVYYARMEAFDTSVIKMLLVK